MWLCVSAKIFIFYGFFMLSLYLVRHAKAMAIASTDKERELAPEGREHTAKLGALFTSSLEQPDHVIYSSALRTVQTYDVLKQTGLECDSHVIDEGLYNASASYLWDIITRSEAKSLLLIGHNPALSIVLNRLVADEIAPDLMHFPTATIAHVSFSDETFRDVTQSSKARLHQMVRGSNL